MVQHAWIPAILLALAGFDPISAVLYMTLAAAGATRKALGAYTVATLLTTWALSLAAVFGLAQVLRRFGSRLPHPTRVEEGIALIAVAVGLLGWGVWRLKRPPRRRDPTPRPARTLAPTALALSGVALGLAFVADAVWWATVAFAATLPGRGPAIIVVTMWTVVCQCLLIVLGVGLVTGRDQRVRTAMQRFGADHASALARILTRHRLHPAPAPARHGIPEARSRRGLSRPARMGVSYS